MDAVKAEKVAEQQHYVVREAGGWLGGRRESVGWGEECGGRWAESASRRYTKSSYHLIMAWCGI